MTREAMDEMKALQTGGHRIQFTLLPHEALMLCDLVQVACWNAACDGASAEYARRLVATIAGYFGTHSALATLIRSGWTEVPEARKP